MKIKNYGLLVILLIRFSNFVNADSQTEIYKESNKDLKFDDGSVLEGLNQSPFDSVSNMEVQKNNGLNHLYRLKPHFDVELKQRFTEAGYDP
jgi:hypothetical protein